MLRHLGHEDKYRGASQSKKYVQQRRSRDQHHDLPAPNHGAALSASDSQNTGWKSKFYSQWPLHWTHS